MSFAKDDRVVVTLESAIETHYWKTGERGTIIQTTPCLPSESAPAPPWSAPECPEAAPDEHHVAIFVRMDNGRHLVWRNWEIRPLDPVERLAELACMMRFAIGDRVRPRYTPNRPVGRVTSVSASTGKVAVDFGIESRWCYESELVHADVVSALGRLA